MKSILKRITEILSLPILYVLMQLLIILVASFGYSFYLGLTKNIGTDVEQITNKVNNFINNNALLLLLISALIMLLILRRVMSKNKGMIENTKITKKNVFIIIGMSICTYFAIIFLISLIMMFMSLFNMIPNYEGVSNTITSGAIIWQIAYVVIVGPIVEEIIFRGIIFKRLKGYAIPMWSAVIIQAVLFGLTHLNVIQFISGTLIGILLAVIYQKQKNLYASIIAHMSYNATAIILSQIAGLANIEGILSIMLLLSIPLTIFLIRMFLRHNKDISTECLHKIEE